MLVVSVAAVGAVTHVRYDLRDGWEAEVTIEIRVRVGFVSASSAGEGMCFVDRDC